VSVEIGSVVGRGSPRRNELRHVEIVARVLSTSPATQQANVVLAPRLARAGLV
jgi:hypothetical protein